MNCQDCAAKDATIQAQRQRIRILENIIRQAQNACAAIALSADQLMSQHQPRAKWAFAKGAKQAAQVISRYLAC